MLLACFDGSPLGHPPTGVDLRLRMQDVALRAGVSATTVSHVINRTRPIAPETKKRVLRAIKELNYFHNASARLLARGESNSYGLLISDIENPFFPELIKSFERSCLVKHMSLLISTTNYDFEQSRNAVYRMIESKVRGVAILTSQIDPKLVDQLRLSDIPIVLLDSCAAVKMGSNIRVDYLQGARQAIQHLRDLGHRSLGLITGSPERYSACRYKDALLQAIEESSLASPPMFSGNNTPESGATGVGFLMSHKAKPTAILCGNDLSALGAIRALFEAGYRVPRDVSVIGADDILFSRFSSPPLTTVRIPRDQLGNIAFEALQAMSSAQAKAGSDYLLGTYLLLRESTDRGPDAVATAVNRELNSLDK